LTGRTKETHEYLRKSAEKRKQLNEQNTPWLKESWDRRRIKLKEMSEEERKEIYSHPCSEDLKQKLSIDRIGKTKENCHRVKKI